MPWPILDFSVVGVISLQIHEATLWAFLSEQPLRSRSRLTQALETPKNMRSFQFTTLKNSGRTGLYRA